MRYGSRPGTGESNLRWREWRRRESSVLKDKFVGVSSGDDQFLVCCDADGCTPKIFYAPNRSFALRETSTTNPGYRNMLTNDCPPTAIRTAIRDSLLGPLQPHKR